jgi:RNA polymerase sigma-70 factor (ECF subfamily)
MRENDDLSRIPMEDDAAAATFVAVVPSDLRPVARKIEEALAGHSDVLVVCERRAGQRRLLGEDRRRREDDHGPDRRHIAHVRGRRVSERRATVVAWRDADQLLPDELRELGRNLTWLERRPPSARMAARLDTARLAVRYQGGDHGVLALLYVRYFRRLRRYLETGVDHSRAEELAQEVFVRVFHRLDRLTALDGGVEGWLFQIARNLMIDELRARKRKPSAPHDPQDLVTQSDLRQRHDSDDDELRFELAALQRLGPEHARVLFLRYVADLSWDQVGDAMDRSAGAARMLHQRALAALRAEVLAGEGADEAARESEEVCE